MQATVIDSIGSRPKGKWRKRFGALRRVIFLTLSLIFALSLIGRDDYQPDELQERAIAQRFEDDNFDLIGWEVSAISDKVQAFFQPSTTLTDEERVDLVLTYLDRAHEIARLSAELNRLAASNTQDDSTTDDSTAAATATGATDQGGESLDPAKLESQIADLRRAQEEVRSTVEELIQSQIGWALREEQISVGSQVIPPVLFSFTEPPKKLVVSPRDRIETRYAQMLSADIPLQTISENEKEILEEEDLSAYVTNIGGLGAFPTMVIDRASLGWILSTVAHEWIHNYLTLFPLGINYGKNNEITIINETVAEIIGNEIGAMVENKFYPPEPTATPTRMQTPTPAPTAAPLGGPSNQTTITQNDSSQQEIAEDETPPFDFRTEMRETRLEVDRLLEGNLVEEAEQYMEARRLVFVENGYNLRVLNQAYFAFHGSYGTSAASTSTIGPKLEALRERSGDLKAFLEVVRWITTEAEIDQALESTP